MTIKHKCKEQIQLEYLKKIAFRIFALGHGYRTCADVLDLSPYTVREWYAMYKFGAYDRSEMGVSTRHGAIYTSEFRQKVVDDYLTNQEPISVLAKRYEISRRTVRRWIDNVEQINKVLQK